MLTRVPIFVTLMQDHHRLSLKPTITVIGIHYIVQSSVQVRSIAGHAAHMSPTQRPSWP